MPLVFRHLLIFADFFMYRNTVFNIYYEILEREVAE